MNNQSKIGIVAFGFGEPAGIKPNIEIATQATELARAQDVSVIYTDRDVAPHLSECSVEVRALNSVLFPHTYRMAVFAVEQAKEQGAEVLHVVAAPCHAWRCLRDLRWAAKDCEVTIKLVLRPTTSFPYDSNATTWYTRSMWVWWPMEIMYRIVSSLLQSVYKRLRA